MKSLPVLAGVVLLLLLWSVPLAGAKEAEFIGVPGCTSKCHKKADEGDQRAAWEKSKHAKAFENLGTQEAKDRAKKVGVTTDPQKSEACLICHTTGFGLEANRFGAKFKASNGVQCESCHGAGGDYSKKKTMLQITRERGLDGKTESATAKKMGLIFPDENTCKTCHAPEITFKGKTYKNPSFEEFDFKKQHEEIKHPVPEARKKKVLAGGSSDEGGDDE